jgi:hypothetical protein
VAKRKSISKKIRFEVFKRDCFTCQYCGKSAPDIFLEIDHVDPVFNGGEDDMLNLITSCFDCNRGKGKRKLSDSTTLAKQRQELKILQDKREQLEMMLKWKKSILNINEEEIKVLTEYWGNFTSGWSLAESGIADLRKQIKKFGVKEIMDAMDISANKYIRYDDDGKITKESIEKAFEYIFRICIVARAAQKEPYLVDLFYIRGILKRRLYYCNSQKSLELMKKAVTLGITVDELKKLALSTRNWSEWLEEIENAIKCEEETLG